MSYDSGHTETQTALPDPLASAGVWNVGAWALPAAMLSLCSALVFASVIALLQFVGVQQELFVLPFPGALAISAAGALLAWVIVYRCRRRPGRLWPRIWALMLAVANSIITIVGLVYRDRSWALTLAVAGLASAIALAPRLAKLRPDSAMVQRVAPLSLLILFIIVPSALAVRNAIARQTADRVDARIRQFRVWTMAVKDVTDFDWPHMEDSADAPAKKIDMLKKLSFDHVTDDPELWHSATILGKDTELAAAMQALTDAVVAGFAPDRVPKVSGLREPAIRWNSQEKRWESYTQFSRLSDITGAYHQELGRLYRELASQDESGKIAKLIDYRQHYGTQKRILQTHLRQATRSWTDDWAVYKVPSHAELVGREAAAIDEVLRTPFAEDEAGSLAPAQLWRLTSLPLQEVKKLANGSPGCEGGNSVTGGRARGCHCQNFEEGDREYFRLDCYAYAPRKGSTGAELRIEMRLVYESMPWSRLGSMSQPAEVYFHFMIPDGRESDDFREEVMTGLASAARRFLRDGNVRSTDRGGSAAGGFTIEDRDGRVRVLRPTVVSLTGLTPEPKALRVRVIRADGASGG